VAQYGGVVPHIVSELLGYKHVVVSMDMATPVHQPPRSKVCKLANAKAFASHKSTARFAHCRAWCAPLYPSLVLGRVTARRGFSRCGRDVKANTPNLPSLATISLGDSFRPIVEESCLDMPVPSPRSLVSMRHTLRSLVGPARFRFVLLAVGRPLYRE
jgi:hypothetical protein